MADGNGSFTGKTPHIHLPWRGWDEEPLQYTAMINREEIAYAYQDRCSVTIALKSGETLLLGFRNVADARAVMVGLVGEGPLILNPEQCLRATTRAAR